MAVNLPLPPNIKRNKIQDGDKATKAFSIVSGPFLKLGGPKLLSQELRNENIIRNFQLDPRGNVVQVINLNDFLQGNPAIAQVINPNLLTFNTSVGLDVGTFDLSQQQYIPNPGVVDTVVNAISTELNEIKDRFPLIKDYNESISLLLINAILIKLPTRISFQSDTNVNIDLDFSFFKEVEAGFSFSNLDNKFYGNGKLDYVNSAQNRFYLIIEAKRYSNGVRREDNFIVEGIAQLLCEMYSVSMITGLLPPFGIVSTGATWVIVRIDNWQISFWRTSIITMPARTVNPNNLRELIRCIFSISRYMVEL